MLFNKQKRGVSFSGSLPFDEESTALVPGLQHLSHGPSFFWFDRHLCDSTQSCTLDSANRVDFGHTGSRASVKGLVSSDGGPFATMFNHYLPFYVSLVLDSSAWYLDALACHWSVLSSYAFPPWPILGKVLRKLRLDKANMSLIAPKCPAQAWYLELLVLTRTSSSLQVSVARFFLDYTSLVSQAHKPSTRRVYDFMWKRLVQWSSDFQFSSTSPRSLQLAIFAFLFSVLHLSASSVKMHKISCSDYYSSIWWSFLVLLHD